MIGQRLKMLKIEISFISILVLCLSAGTLEAQGEKTVLVFFSSKFAPYKQASQGFCERLEGREVRLVERYLSEVSNSLREEIGKEKPDLIFSIGTQATKALKDMDSTIPTVFTFVVDPVGDSYIASEQSSQNNLCGVSIDISVDEQFNFIKKILPATRTIGIIYSTEGEALLIKAQKIADSLGMQLVKAKVGDQANVHNALDFLTGKIDVLWSIPDTITFAAGETILLHTIRHKIPFVGFSLNYVKAGAFLTMYGDYTDIGRQCADNALKILFEGKKPADIPLQEPRKVLFAFNLKAVQMIGITIPPEIKKKASVLF